MSTLSQPPLPPLEPANSSRGKLAIPILAGAVIALIGANVYLFMELNKFRAEMRQADERILEQIAKTHEQTSVSTATAHQRMEALRDELEAARRQAAMAAGQAKIEAEKHAEELAKRLEAEQKRAAEQVNRVSSEVSEVRQTATTTNTRLGEVSTEVGNVKTEVASTKAELDKTIANLKRVVGDVDQHASLIATNSKELAALRALGERNYYEFNIRKAKTPTKVADVSIAVKKTDPKHNRFTIEVIADDKKVEKKDKNINEPLQFYVPSKARQPWEIVVNEVRKDQIIGYLSTPKVQTGR